MGSTSSAVTKVKDFDDLTIGIVGTGRMGMAHASAWTKLGMKVVIGSRDAARGQQAAAKIGNGCVGGGHAEMLEASNFILLCIMPGPDSISFVDYMKPLVEGKCKMFCDSASWTQSLRSRLITCSTHPCGLPPQ